MPPTLTNIFESTPGSGSRLSSTDDELCGKIERILQAYYDLIAPYAEESILVRVALLRYLGHHSC